MSEKEFDEVLKSRACSRPDSFCQKLLRKLKLAKKTDTSSGVAVIDITDDDNNDGTSPGKRKYFQFEENTYSNEDALTNGASTPLNHYRSEVEVGETSNNKKLKLSHYPKNGNTISEPIVIDDDDDEDNENDGKTDAVNDMATDDKNLGADVDSEIKSTQKDSDIDEKNEKKNENIIDSIDENNEVQQIECTDKESEMESESTESESAEMKENTNSDTKTSLDNEIENSSPPGNSNDSSKNDNSETIEKSDSETCNSVQSLRVSAKQTNENKNNSRVSESENCTKSSDIPSDSVVSKGAVCKNDSSVNKDCSPKNNSSTSNGLIASTENSKITESSKSNETCTTQCDTPQGFSDKKESTENLKSCTDSKVLFNDTCEQEQSFDKNEPNTVECAEISSVDTALPEIDSSAVTVEKPDKSINEEIVDNKKQNNLDEVAVQEKPEIVDRSNDVITENSDVAATSNIPADDVIEDDDEDDIEIVSEDVGCVLSYGK